MPIIFSKAPGSLAGAHAAILLPVNSTQVDYEGELGVVIGKAGRNIPAERWQEHVFGYTVVNDVSARDLQKAHQQWFLAKSCDTFCPCGPWIVPAECLDGTRARIRTWVNGELRQDGNSCDLLFPMPALIATISAGMTLRPGDLILTGTPAGVGAGMKPQRWLAPGDVVRVQIDGIGALENRVARAAAL